ncbi:hypothetical protein HPP92_006609 [Vanilla planifolia]|uniref:Uncharacterized protein n=1 Tax=Vanilla planifolia TaxID=51239 RepID=A0A835RCC8_VANPL|nr:hypothetical protein HPP92_006609 [Vanilla planifolia]
MTNKPLDVKVNGEEAPKRVDVVQAFEDARDFVKSFLGAPKFIFAVVVIPSSTHLRNREAIRCIARGAGLNVVNVIDEKIAVANAYGEKVRDTNKRIARPSLPDIKGDFNQSQIARPQECWRTLLSEEFNVEVDEVVFVGKGSKFEKVRHAVQQKYPKATEWEGIAAEVTAAYGAAVVALHGKGVRNAILSALRVRNKHYTTIQQTKQLQQQTVPRRRIH